MQITSPAFSDRGPIPRAHTCDGADQSPPLAWTGVPPDARQLALIVDDPDAPGRVFVHWVLYGIVPSVTALPSGLSGDARLTGAIAALQGTNDFRKTGYNGPCPPPGGPHRYVFTLYALKQELALPPGATKTVLLEAMKGHVLEQATLTGTYGRSRAS
ncbi:MAG: YbhB/YbcL family Raf kinase inhibitor-like protein [Gemmatimonadetes bacterium]|nr:YbhB/YbcL family Raf kinase inhibitor-like protein [Gemmatimonadota bacterium]